MDPGVPGEDGRQLATTPLRRAGAVLQGGVIDQTAVPGEPLSDVISICYILGFRKDNAKFFNKLSLNR